MGIRLMVEKRRLSINKINENILVVLFAIYTCRSLYLAFDKESYFPLYAFLSLNLARMCIPIGIIYL